MDGTQLTNQTHHNKIPSNLSVHTKTTFLILNAYGRAEEGKMNCGAL